MARDDQGWNQDRSRQGWREEQERGRSRGGEWSDANDYYGNRSDESRYGQGSYTQRPGRHEQEGFGTGRGRGEWGQQGWGSYTRGGEQGARGEYGNERGQEFPRDYNREQGGEQGRPRSGFGNTAGGNYGGGNYGIGNYGVGGGYGGSSATGGLSGGFGGYGSSGFSAGGGYQGNWGQGQPTYEPSFQPPQQQSTPHSYIGRGPKGWKRSDERIREDVNEQLERHPQIDASEIEVNVEDGEVTLRGTASDRRTKRMAEDVVENVSGVREVQNHIRVKREGGMLSQLFGGEDRPRDEPRDRSSSQSAPTSGGMAGATAGGQTTSGSSGTSSSTKGNR